MRCCKRDQKGGEGRAFVRDMVRANMLGAVVSRIGARSSESHCTASRRKVAKQETASACLRETAAHSNEHFIKVFS